MSARTGTMNGAAPTPNTANDISTIAKFLDREQKQYYLFNVIVFASEEDKTTKFSTDFFPNTLD